MTARTTLLLVESERHEDSSPAFGLKVDSVSRFEDVPPAHIRRCREGFRVLLNEKWRPVINLTEVAVQLYEWSRERNAITI